MSFSHAGNTFDTSEYKTKMQPEPPRPVPATKSSPGLLTSLLARIGSLFSCRRRRPRPDSTEIRTSISLFPRDEVPAPENMHDPDASNTRIHAERKESSVLPSPEEPGPALEPMEFPQRKRLQPERCAETETSTKDSEKEQPAPTRKRWADLDFLEKEEQARVDDLNLSASPRKKAEHGVDAIAPAPKPIPRNTHESEENMDPNFVPAAEKKPSTVRILGRPPAERGPREKFYAPIVFQPRRGVRKPGKNVGVAAAKSVFRAKAKEKQKQDRKKKLPTARAQTGNRQLDK